MLSQMQGITYNKFETSNDWLKIDKTFDYKIENGKLLSGNEHIYLKGPLNYEINGDTSGIVDGIFTRTSNSPVLSFSIPTSDRESFKTQDWEIATYIDLTSVKRDTIDNNLIFIGGRYNYKIGANEGLGCQGFYINSTSTAFVTYVGDNPFELNLGRNPYWIKFGRSGSLVYLSCSLDNINWQTTKWNNITASENSRDIMYILQSQSLTTDSWVGAKIDLKQTYIRLNNQLYFYNKLNTTNHIIPVPNNFTYGNTITDSIGYVDVRTQEFTSAPEGTIIIKDDEHFRQVQTYQDKGIVDYTVVGSPTIIDGIVSGFSSSNYLEIRNPYNLGITNLEIVLHLLDIPAFVSGVYGLAGTGLRFIVYIRDTGAVSCYYTSGGNVVYLGNTTVYSSGYFKFILSSTQGVTESYSADGVTWTTLVTKTEIPDNLSYMDWAKIGYISSTYPGFTGSIDLNETYIKVNGQYWFHPYPNSYPKLVGPVDYTVVGSPTITNGLVTTGNTSNYLSLTSPLNLSGNEVEIISKFTGVVRFFVANVTGTSNYFSLQMTSSDNFVLSTSDGLKWGPTKSTNEYVRFYKSADDSVTTLSVGTSPTTWTSTVSLSDVIYYNTGDIRLCNSIPSGSVLDLNNTYIKVNGALWFGKEDWTPCIYENNAIYLSVLEDSNTNYLGFNPTISNSGNYDVYIDNQKIVEEKSGQTSIDWDNLNLDTGYTYNNITYHTLKICPSIKTNNITSYKAARVQSSGYENQGIVRAIIACDNIDLSNAFETNNEVKNSNLKSIESYTSELMVTAIKEMTTINELEHIDRINNTSNTPISLYKAINSSDVKYISLKGNFTSEGYKFSNNTSLEKIDTKEYLKFNNNDFENNYSLKMLPNGVINNVDQNNLTNFITNTTNLYPTDLSINYSTISKLDVYGNNNYFITNLNSITVSNEAYFGGTAPQINVSYTGLDVNALVKLFNSLPTVTNGQTINIEGCSGTNNLTLEQIAIATNKGWNVYGYNNSQVNGFPYNLPIDL